MAVFVQPHFNISFKEPISMSGKVLQEDSKPTSCRVQTSARKGDLAMPSAALRQP